MVDNDLVKKNSLGGWVGDLVTLEQKGEDVFSGVLMIDPESNLPFVRKESVDNVREYGNFGDLPVYVGDSIGLPDVRNSGRLRSYDVV